MKIHAVNLALAAITVALGVFLGLYAWHAYQRIDAQRAQAAAAAASEAAGAQFRNEAPGRRVPGVWCGEVNARNRMGGWSGFTRYVAVVQDDRELAALDRVTFEEPSEQGEPRSGFQNRWALMCE